MILPRGMFYLLEGDYRALGLDSPLYLLKGDYRAFGA